MTYSLRVDRLYWRQQTSLQHRLRLSLSPKAPPRLLKLLSRYFPREAARHPQTPPETLLSLAGGGRYRQDVLGNPVLPLIELERPGFREEVEDALPF